MLAQRRRRWHSITSALDQCIVLSGVSVAGMLKRHQHNAAVKNTVQSPNVVSMTGQRRRLRKVYNRPGERLVLGLRRRRLTGIEPAMGSDAGPKFEQEFRR